LALVRKLVVAVEVHRGPVPMFKVAEAAGAVPGCREVGDTGGRSGEGGEVARS